LFFFCCFFFRRELSSNSGDDSRVILMTIPTRIRLLTIHLYRLSRPVTGFDFVSDLRGCFQRRQWSKCRRWQFSQYRSGSSRSARPKRHFIVCPISAVCAAKRYLVRLGTLSPRILPKSLPIAQTQAFGDSEVDKRTPGSGLSRHRSRSVPMTGC
jgi:hypothetical protein